MTDQILGSLPGNKEIFRDYIAAKAPGGAEGEENALGFEEMIEKGSTVFPKTDGKPFLYDYQIKGFFKNACQMLRRVEGTASSKIRAYKKEIDGLIFIKDRENYFECSGEISQMERPLRAQTMQGERVSIVSSECLPEGSKVSFSVIMLNDGLEGAVREWLDYGAFNGLGQWHNSGKGRFVWEEVS